MVKRFFLLVLFLVSQSTLSVYASCEMLPIQDEATTLIEHDKQHACCPSEADSLEQQSLDDKNCDCPDGVVSLLDATKLDSLAIVPHAIGIRLSKRLSKYWRDLLLRPPIFV